MALSPKAKLLVVILCTPLLLIDFAIWVFNTVHYREIWECTAYRTDDEPSIQQRFLFFTVWSSILAWLLFPAWALSRPGTKLRKAAQIIFWIALPHSCIVMVGFICYLEGIPEDSLWNETTYDKCHGSAISKDFAPERTSMVDFYIVMVYVANCISHFWVAPLLLLLLFSGELYYDVIIPYSAVFEIVLGLAVGFAQTYGSPIYAGNIWFWVGGMILGNLVFHVLFVLWHRRMPSCFYRCCSKREEEKLVDDSVSVTGRSEDFEIVCSEEGRIDDTSSITCSEVDIDVLRGVSSNRNSIGGY